MITQASLWPEPFDLVGFHQRLLQRYGAVETGARLAPVDQIVRTMLGARTRDADSVAAFWRLKRRYADWPAMIEAGPETMLPLIEAVTFAEDKARRIPLALQRIRQARGELSLDFLADWPVAASLNWLERLPGVGRKVSAAVLNFSTLDKPALVIDSHHLRVMKRLGVVRWKANTPEAYDRLMEFAPAEWAAEDFRVHHGLVKQLGQTLCAPFEPACRSCPLNALCPSRY